MRATSLLGALLLLSACEQVDRVERAARVIIAEFATEPLPVVNITESLRKTQDGEVIGYLHPVGSFVWHGIPFAAPPVGDLRWQVAQPVHPWDTTLDAKEVKAPCSQIGSQFGGAPDDVEGQVWGDEDCLVLSVWSPPMTPSDAKGANLPVIFWIHGGGNTFGGIHQYDFGALAAYENAIVVAAQYRLGPLGFFSHPSAPNQALGPDAPHTRYERTSNYAITDLIEALRWVQRNIDAFGGSPNRVVIAGESAGAVNVFALMSTPHSEGLFHAAIAQSGGLWSSSMEEAQAFERDGGFPLSGRELIAKTLAIKNPQLGLAGARAMGGSKLRVLMQQLSIADLYRPLMEGAFDSLWATLPTVTDDGMLWSEDGLAAQWEVQGAVRPVPMILGTNRDENKLFAASDPSLTWRLGPLIHIKDQGWYNDLTSWQSRQWHIEGALTPARQTKRANPDQPVWMYRFDWDDQPTILRWVDFSQIFGAAHAMEIPFLEGRLGADSGLASLVPENDANRELSRAIQSYWTSLADLQDPNGRSMVSGIDRWREFTLERPNMMVFAAKGDGGNRMMINVESQDQIIEAITSKALTKDQLCSVFQWAQRYEPVIEAVEEAFPNQRMACQT